MNINKASNTVVIKRTPEVTPPPTPDVKGQSVLVGRAVKRMSSNIFRNPFGPTVVHRSHPKARPSLAAALGVAPTTPGPESPASSATTQSTSYSFLSTPTGNSTGKTSLDSKDSKVSYREYVEKKPVNVKRRGPVIRSNPEVNLKPIEETVFDATNPTVITVERAAAAKIFLETHFNEMLSRPSPRSLRRRYMEAGLYRAENLSPQEKEQCRAMFYRTETDHLRERRVMKARSIQALNLSSGNTKSH